MARTWRSRAIADIFSATIWAVRPDMPVSTSSKISVSVLSSAANMVLMPSMMRESSPPETTFESSRLGSPGLVAIMKETASQPFAV